MTAHVRRVEADFEAPEGATEAEAAVLKAEAIRAAMFDPSKEANLARQYEMAAERGFYRAIKQLRQMELQGEALMKVDDEARTQELMASFLKNAKDNREIDADLDALEAKYGMARDPLAGSSAHFTQTSKRVDVPFTIGKPR